MKYLEMTIEELLEFVIRTKQIPMETYEKEDDVEDVCYFDMQEDCIGQHNALRGRFVDSDMETACQGTEICHDAKFVIFDDGNTVQDKIAELERKVNDMEMNVAYLEENSKR